MYAIVATGGKQYRVEEGQTLEVERLGGAGSEVELRPVMIVDGDDVLATPTDLQGASVSATVIDGAPNEFPRHRGSLTTKPYRYGYCASPSTDPAVGWPTLKHDLSTGERLAFDHGPGRAAGEPVFVGRADGEAEDDGWLVTFVHDLVRESAEFVVIDARDFDRGYVAKVPLPQRVPYGFHGNWVSDRSVSPS